MLYRCYNVTVYTLVYVYTYNIFHCITLRNRLLYPKDLLLKTETCYHIKYKVVNTCSDIVVTRFKHFKLYSIIPYCEASRPDVPYDSNRATLCNNCVQAFQKEASVHPLVLLAEKPLWTDSFGIVSLTPLFIHPKFIPACEPGFLALLCATAQQSYCHDVGVRCPAVDFVFPETVKCVDTRFW